MSDAGRGLCESAKAKHLEGRMLEAEWLYREALRTDPTNLEILHGLGMLCLQTGRPEAAVKYLRQAAESSASADVCNNLGVALCRLRRFTEAADAFRRAVAAEPDSDQSLVNLGHALNLMGRHGEALAFLEKAAALRSDSLEASHQLGVALLELQRPDEAAAYLEKAVALAPERFELRSELGSALTRCGRHSEAVRQFEAVLSQRPDFVPALCGLGDALGGLDRHEEAAASFARALALAPGIALIHYNYGSALTFLGRLNEAQFAYRRAATLAPDVPSYRYAAMAMKKTAADDPDLRALEEMATAAVNLSERERAQLHIALAKAYDDLERHEDAFEQLKRGNAVKRRLVNYDEERELGRLRAATAAFTAEFLTAHAGLGADSQLPIFIVGMPRSGTTLVEQILASHPAVHGAGEQPILPRLVAEGLAGAEFPSTIAERGAAAWNRLGENYLAQLSALAPKASRITDKMPSNFLYVGLIRLALPGARIVHVRRDALDTCFSCYSRLFEGNVDYAYDLGELGRYYRAYEALMAHWRAVLPAEAMLELRYEELVGNFEPQARRLVAFCGLEWDERCRAFHNVKRGVRTASAVQVRQPLYDSAVGRAAHYAAWLGPLEAALRGP